MMFRKKVQVAGVSIRVEAGVPPKPEALKRVLATELVSGAECRRCTNTMQIRDGEEPTLLCDHCIQDLWPQAMSLLRRYTANDFVHGGCDGLTSEAEEFIEAFDDIE